MSTALSFVQDDLRTSFFLSFTVGSQKARLSVENAIVGWFEKSLTDLFTHCSVTFPPPDYFQVPPPGNAHAVVSFVYQELADKFNSCIPDPPKLTLTVPGLRGLDPPRPSDVIEIAIVSSLAWHKSSLEALAGPPAVTVYIRKIPLNVPLRMWDDFLCKSRDNLPPRAARTSLSFWADQPTKRKNGIVTGTVRPHDDDPTAARIPGVLWLLPMQMEPILISVSSRKCEFCGGDHWSRDHRYFTKSRKMPYGVSSSSTLREAHKAAGISLAFLPRPHLSPPSTILDLIWFLAYPPAGHSESFNPPSLPSPFGFWWPWWCSLCHGEEVHVSPEAPYPRNQFHLLRPLGGTLDMQPQIMRSRGLPSRWYLCTGCSITRATAKSLCNGAPNGCPPSKQGACCPALLLQRRHPPGHLSDIYHLGRGFPLPPPGFGIRSPLATPSQGPSRS